MSPVGAVRDDQLGKFPVQPRWSVRTPKMAADAMSSGGAPRRIS